ncbi:MAG: sigma-70 family RNA polymerase sigma factor [Clostridia bacterium]|nr:sigma-70 family RNA polymerase sigma factor [Clostridia bacterium]
MEEKLNVLTDHELIKMAQEGSKTATDILLKKYEKLVLKVSHSYFLNVASSLSIDCDVVFQEGRLGLHDAVKTYDLSKDTSFMTYASTCISHRVINNLKKQTKDSIPFESVSMDETNGTDEIFQLASGDNTEEEVLLNSFFEELNRKDSELFSDFERIVLRELISGLSYREIAKELDKTPKSIDNTIQRLKKKIYAYLR